MYNKEESICITCDNCGETFLDDHTGFALYADEINANEAADNAGWYSEDSKHYCPDCHTIDDDDNLVLKNLPPSYEVIAEFPNNIDFPKGKKIEFQPWAECSLYWAHIIEDCQGKREWLSGHFDNYPHLFRRIR